MLCVVRVTCLKCILVVLLKMNHVTVNSLNAIFFLQIFETATIINYSCFGEVVLLGIQPYCMWKIDKNMKPKIRYSKENHKCKV